MWNQLHVQTLDFLAPCFWSSHPGIPGGDARDPIRVSSTPLNKLRIGCIQWEQAATTDPLAGIAAHEQQRAKHKMLC
jgi:hypothetical protein